MYTCFTIFMIILDNNLRKCRVWHTTSTIEASNNVAQMSDCIIPVTDLLGPDTFL